MANILVVEDEPEIRSLIVTDLTLVGHHCVSAEDADQALAATSSNHFDLAVLDVLLPGSNGFALLPKLGDIPVIFLTALGSLPDRLRGLDLGADDYIVKPFEALELIARINAVLRRTMKGDDSFALGDVIVDFTKRTVTNHGSLVDMTPQEFNLLETLVINRNIAMSRDQLLERAWGYDFAGGTRTVDSHIQHLRTKLGWESVIKTVYKLGYRLET